MKQKYLLVAIKAAWEAGQDILSIYDSPVSDFQVERKSDDSPLTIADKKSHQRIVSYLQDTPYPVLSEEGQNISYDIRRKWDTLWIVDPLDGTKEFIKKNGEFTVNIALVEKGIPVLGVIYVPVKKQLYFASLEVGAYKIEGFSYLDESIESLLTRAVRLPLSIKKDEYTVVASRSHLTPETETFIEGIREKYSSVKLISSGSSLKICLVAEGTADVYPRFAPTMEWDTAAGHAIVKAAGAEIYQIDNEKKTVPLLYNKENLLNPWFIVEK